MTAYNAFARVYDRLMGDVDYDAWYQHYRACINQAGVIASAADICCGTGRFTLRLACDGIRTVGADISEEMLAVAQQNARIMGVQARFVRMDAAKLELPRPVDAMLCACDGINYLSPEAVCAFFSKAYTYLRPGGVLAFDISTAHKFQNVLDGRAFGEDQEDICYLWTNEYDRTTRICHMELTIFSRQKDGAYRRDYEEHTLRAHSVRELTRWLRGAGFVDIAFYSEMTLNTHRRGDHRIHAVAVRAK